MTLAQKMLAQNGITPTETTDNTGQDASQSGDNPGTTENPTGKDTAAADTDASANISTSTTDQDHSKEPDEPDEAAILKMLEKKGIKVPSLAALTPHEPETVLTDEEKATVEQQRQNDIRSFALQTGKVTTTQLDNYIRESSAPDKDLAFNLYKEERLADERAAKTAPDDLPTDSDLRYEFDELNFQHADETDPKRKAAEKRLKKTVDEHLQSKYENIYSLEDEYTRDQETRKLRKHYDAEVASAITSLAEKMEFEIMDEGRQKIKYPVKLTPEEIKEITSLYTGDEMFSSIGGKATKADISAAIKNSLFAKNMNRIINDVANAHAAAKIRAIKLGRREIFSTTEHTQADGKETKPMVKKVLEANRAKPN